MSRTVRTQRLREFACAGVLCLVCASAASAQSAPATAGLDLVNRASAPITDVRLASRVMGSWGNNLLSGHVSPGQRQSIVPQRQEGCLYSVRVVYGGNRFERFAMLDLCRNKEYVVAAKFAQPIANQHNYDSPPASEVGVLNRSQTTIRVLRMSPTGDRMWGPNRLGNQVLPPGKRHSVTLDKDRGCLYRVYAYYDDTKVEIISSANLCDDSNVRFTRKVLYKSGQLPANMRLETTNAIVVSNQSGLQIDWIYVFPVNDRGRGPDRLGRNVLPSGRHLRIDLTDLSVCVVTVLPVYHDRREERLPPVDLCAAHEPQVVARGPLGNPQGVPSRP